MSIPEAAQGVKMHLLLVHVCTPMLQLTACAEFMRICRVPITVIKPHTVHTNEAPARNLMAKAPSAEPLHAGATVDLGLLVFQPGTVVRRFIAVPDGATWAELRIMAGPHDVPKSVPPGCLSYLCDFPFICCVMLALARKIFRYMAGYGVMC